MSTVRERMAGRLQLLAAAALFSTGGAAIKATTLTSVQVASFRSFIAAIVVVALVPAARRIPSARAAVVSLAYAATVILFVLANKLTTSANTIFLQSTAPVYVLLGAPWLLGERWSARDLAFVTVAGAGLAMFFVGSEPPRASAPDPATGNLLATGSGIAWAATILGLRWMGAQGGAGNGPVNAVVAGNALAFAICLPFALPVDSLTAGDAAVLFYLGVFQIAAPYLLVASAVRHLPALEVSMLLLVEPVLNPIWALLLHGEVPGPYALLGGAVLIGATAAKGWADLRVRA